MSARLYPLDQVGLELLGAWSLLSDVSGCGAAHPSGRLNLLLQSGPSLISLSFSLNQSSLFVTRHRLGL